MFTTPAVGSCSAPAATLVAPTSVKFWARFWAVTMISPDAASAAAELEDGAAVSAIATPWTDATPRTTRLMPLDHLFITSPFFKQIEIFTHSRGALTGAFARLFGSKIGCYASPIRSSSQM